jgi:hypothetical protein
MVRYFFLSLNVLNGLLAAAVAAVAYYAIIPSLNPVARISLSPAQGTTASSGKMAAPAQNLPAADYAVISNQNLFHPERKILPEKQPEKALPKPDVFLYGTLIADDASIALIEDKKTPYSTPGRGKRQTILKKGDHLSGYILSEIEANRIVLVKGEEKVVVMLDDREKRRTGETQAVAAMPTTARTAAGGIAPSPPGAPPSVPQAMPSPIPAMVSPGPGIPGPPPRPSPPPSISSSPQMMPPSAQDAPPSKPGIGASGAWPPTKSSIEPTQQKIQQGRQIRAEQIQRNK